MVEDDEQFLRVLRKGLEKAGYSVATAADGREALDRIAQQLPDLAILDLAMPVMDGPTTLEAIRERWEALPVIILTGFPDSDLMMQAVAFCPFSVMSKPFRDDEIVSAVAIVLNGSTNTARREGAVSPVMEEGTKTD